MVERYTLVPEEIFSEARARDYLSEVVPLKKEEPLSFLKLPHVHAYLVFADERPHVYDMLMSLTKISDYNKIIVSLRDGCLDLVVGKGMELALCNSFAAESATTALYYVCMALNRLQINPQVSTVFFASDAGVDVMELFLRYFRGVEVIE